MECYQTQASAATFVAKAERTLRVWDGMVSPHRLAVVGYGVRSGARVASVTDATQFVISIVMIATTTGRNFTAVSMATASPDAHLMWVNLGGVD